MKPLNGLVRFSQLSPPRQVLIRLCQSLNFGQIRGIRVQDAEPVFDPPPVVLADTKLNSDEGPRPETQLQDFELPVEVRRLMFRLDDLRNGRIERIEVRSGIPRRMVMERPLDIVNR